MSVNRLVLKRAVPGQQQATQRGREPQRQAVEKQSQGDERTVDRERDTERYEIDVALLRYPGGSNEARRDLQKRSCCYSFGFYSPHDAAVVRQHGVKGFSVRAK